MKRKTPYRGENYWPGYVDALVNVILNLVFMVAVFLIALVVANSVQKANILKTELPIIDNLKNPLFGDIETDLDFGLSKVTATVIIANFQQMDIDDPDIETSGPIETLPMHVSSAQAELPSTFMTPAPPQEDEPSAFDPARPMLGADQTDRPDDLGKGYEAEDEVFSAHPEAAQMALSNQISDVQTEKVLPESLISIIIADGYSGRGGPNAQLSKRLDSGGRTIMTIDLPVLADPVTSLSRDYLSSAFKAALPLESKSFTLLFTTELAEPIRRRSAYLALSVIRNQLIQAGVDPARIDIQLLNGKAVNDTNVKFFIIASGR